MMKPEVQSPDQSRVDLSTNQMRISNTIQHQESYNDINMNVEIPSQVLASAKNTGRSGLNYMKNTTQAFGSRKNSHIKHPLLEDSPRRDLSAERLPQLTIRVS